MTNNLIIQDIGILGLYAETSMHPGGESVIGYVDMPIQREKHSQYPVIPGSSIKGILRDESDKSKKPHIDPIFGKQDEAGKCSFGDGLILAFPIRSVQAPFFWVTCPHVLERYFRVYKRVTNEEIRAPQIAECVDALSKIHHNDRVLLEENIVNVYQDEATIVNVSDAILKLVPNGTLFNHVRTEFPKRLLILKDDIFKRLVLRGTDVVTRIIINNDTGTTENMFVQELIPPETIFFCSIRGRSDVLECFNNGFKFPNLITIGGDESIGRGLTHVTFLRNGGNCHAKYRARTSRICA